MRNAFSSLTPLEYKSSDRALQFYQRRSCFTTDCNMDAVRFQIVVEVNIVMCKQSTP